MSPVATGDLATGDQVTVKIMRIIGGEWFDALRLLTTKSKLNHPEQVTSFARNASKDLEK